LSHFTKLSKAQVTSVEAFIAACAELGLKDVRKNAKSKDYYGKEILADAAVRVTDKYDIAIVKGVKKGRYDIVADWWGIKKDQAFQDRLLQLTTKHTIIEKYRRLGFRASVKEDSEKNLTVNLVRS
jgi:hypothetical protein